jgi:hypothetical protein
MSINLGNDAIAAAAELRTSEAWATFRAGLNAQFVRTMHAALDSAPEHRADAIGYARAFRDLTVATEAATLGVQHNRVAKPGGEKIAPASAQPSK